MDCQVDGVFSTAATPRLANQNAKVNDVKDRHEHAVNCSWKKLLAIMREKTTKGTGRGRPRVAISPAISSTLNKSLEQSLPLYTIHPP